MLRWVALLAASLTASLAGTACDAPPAALDAGATDASTQDAGPPGAPMCEGLAASPPSPTCEPLPTDYAPGVDDGWDACVSDDGEYNRVLEDISSIARVAAFEEIAALLFDPSRDPSPQDFLDARLVYQRDEGLDSRVVRRYDPHFDVPEGTDCTTEGTPATRPDYCVGPAILQPLILGALARGFEGSGAPRAEAARVEAGLLWFLYVSTAKESLTCTRTAKDCDSAYAYYTGGESARGGIGLAARVAQADPAAHDAAWDGALALRCWRDLDDAEVATDLEARDLARAQYDRALIDGLAALVRRSLVAACEASEGERIYHWVFAQTLGRALDREARSRDAEAASALRSELAYANPAGADAASAVDALDRIFVCP